MWINVRLRARVQALALALALVPMLAQVPLQERISCYPTLLACTTLWSMPHAGHWCAAAAPS